MSREDRIKRAENLRRKKLKRCERKRGKHRVGRMSGGDKGLFVMDVMTKGRKRPFKMP